MIEYCTDYLVPVFIQVSVEHMGEAALLIS